MTTNTVMELPAKTMITNIPFGVMAMLTVMTLYLGTQMSQTRCTHN